MRARVGMGGGSRAPGLFAGLRLSPDVGLEAPQPPRSTPGTDGDRIPTRTSGHQEGAPRDSA